MLPYLPVRRPTKEEVHTCDRIELTSRYDWNPFLLEDCFSLVANKQSHNYALYLDLILDDTDPIASTLMSLQLPDIISQETLMHEIPDTSSSSENDDIFYSVSQIASPKQTL